jgi:hypothetical protein
MKTKHIIGLGSLGVGMALTLSGKKKMGNAVMLMGLLVELTMDAEANMASQKYVAPKAPAKPIIGGVNYPGMPPLTLTTSGGLSSTSQLQGYFPTDGYFSTGATPCCSNCASGFRCSR